MQKSKKIAAIAAAIILFLILLFSMFLINKKTNTDKSIKNFSQVMAMEDQKFKKLQNNNSVDVKSKLNLDPIVVASENSPKYSKELLSRFNHGINLREFVDYALQHPEMGGAFYATQILNQCGIISRSNFYNEVQSLPVKNETDEKFRSRSRAADWLRSQCSSFIPDDFTSARLNKIAAEGLSKNDPLMLSTKQYNKILGNYVVEGEAAQLRKKALEKIFDTQDPLVLKDIGTAIALQIDPQTKKRGYWYNDKFYYYNSDTDAGLAIYLLPCALGMKCDETEFETAMRCASGVECSSGRFAHVQNMLKSKPSAYEKVIDLYENMANSIRSKSVAHFVR